MNIMCADETHSIKKYVQAVQHFYTDPYLKNSTLHKKKGIVTKYKGCLSQTSLLFGLNLVGSDYADSSKGYKDVVNLF